MRRPVAEKPLPNVCEWTAKARLLIPNTFSFLTVMQMTSEIGGPADLGSAPIVRTTSLAATTIGRVNPGAQRRNGVRNGSTISAGERSGDGPTLTGGAGVSPGLRYCFHQLLF